MRHDPHVRNTTRPNTVVLHLNTHLPLPGARVARALLLRRAGRNRPCARTYRATHPRMAGLPPARAHTDHISDLTVATETASAGL